MVLPTKKRKHQKPIKNGIYWHDPRILLTLLLLIAAFIKLNFLGVPFERDEGAYAYYGMLILDGGLPYVDFHAMKFPLLFYSYAAIELIFGATMTGIQTGFLFVYLGSIILVYSLTKQIFNATTSLFSAAFFMLMSMNLHMSGFTTQSEHLLVLFMLLGIFFLIKGLKNPRFLPFFLAGIFMCSSFQMKQTGFFFVAAAGLIILGHFLFSKKPAWKGFLIHGSYYVSGVLMLLAITFILMILQGTFDDFKFWAFEYSTKYISKIDFAEGKTYLKFFFKNIWNGYQLLWFIGILGIALLVTRINQKREQGILLFGIFSLLTVAPGFRFIPHYWIQTVPALALLAGYGFFRLQDIAKPKMPKTFVVKLVPLLFFGSLIIFLLSKSNYYFAPDKIEVVQELYPGNPFPESVVIADYIKQRTNKDDQIVVLGSEPQIYFYTGLKCPSSFNYHEHINKPFPESHQWQVQFTEEVEQAMPKYIIYLVHSASWMREPGSNEYIFEWAQQLIRENYKRVGFIEFYPKNKVVYAWDEDARQYKTKTDTYITINERIQN